MVTTSSQNMIKIDPDQVIFHQGSPARQFYTIEQGTVELLRNGSGGTVTIDILGPGEPIGYEETVNGESRYTTTARPREPVLLKPHPADESRDRWEDNTKWSFYGKAQLSERLHGQLHSDSAQRLACELCRMALKFGRRTEQGVRIDIHLRRRTLARMVGCRKETISRILSKWTDRDLVADIDNRLVIMDEDEFLELTNRPCDECFIKRMDHFDGVQLP